jgi:hypothetical protein
LENYPAVDEIEVNRVTLMRSTFQSPLYKEVELTAAIEAWSHLVENITIAMVAVSLPASLTEEGEELSRADQDAFLLKSYSKVVAEAEHLLEIVQKKGLK